MTHSKFYCLSMFAFIVPQSHVIYQTREIVAPFHWKLSLFTKMLSYKLLQLIRNTIHTYRFFR